MRIAVVQFNPVVGSIQTNAEQMISQALAHREQGAQVVIFPELALCGYPPLDRLETQGFVDQCALGAKRIAQQTRGVGVIFGLPLRNPQPTGKPLFNGACLTFDGAVQQYWAKTLLPDYDVFDEGRYFAPAPVNFNRLWHWGNVRIAVSICEDLWNDAQGNVYERNPLADETFEQADWVLNLAASPFHLGKDALRHSVLSQVCSRLGKPLLYVNTCGAQAELIFDGSSACFDAAGRCVAALPAFEEIGAQLQWDGGQWRPESAWRSGEGVVAHDVGDSTRTRFQPDDAGDSEAELELLHSALLYGIKDFFGKQNLSRAVIGLSGGIDSALVTLLAVQALGPDRVMALLMPSPFSSGHSVDDSVLLAGQLGIRYHTMPVTPVFMAQQASFERAFGAPMGELTLQNVQSRIRCAFLMAAANEWGGVMLNTSNKSELAVGYGTLYGDTSGALSVLGDLLKTRVYRLAHHLNRNGVLIPAQILDKVPSAELKPNQADSDDLPPYPLLDAILELYVDRKLSPSRIVARGFDEAVVHKIVRMVDFCEFKRFQSPPILRVTEKAFGRGRVMPLVARFVYD